jgi:hypothetical protein
MASSSSAPAFMYVAFGAGAVGEADGCAEEDATAADELYFIFANRSSSSLTSASISKSSSPSASVLDDGGPDWTSTISTFAPVVGDDEFCRFARLGEDSGSLSDVMSMTPPESSGSPGFIPLIRPLASSRQTLRDTYFEN